MKIAQVDDLESIQGSGKPLERDLDSLELQQVGFNPDTVLRGGQKSRRCAAETISQNSQDVPSAGPLRYSPSLSKRTTSHQGGIGTRMRGTGSWPVFLVPLPSVSSMYSIW